MSTTAPRYRQSAVGGCLEAALERRPDGTEILRSTEPLGEHALRVTDALDHWADVAPDRIFLARRDPAVPGGGDWITISYAGMRERARRIGQALVDRGLTAERPIAILSDNDLEHMSLALGALWAGIPFVPISPAYSLVSKDYAKLRYIVDRVTPGMLFASGPEYAAAIAAVGGDDVEVVLASGEITGRKAIPFATLLDTEPGPGLDAAHGRVDGQTIAKFLFTSGSTKNPEGRGQHPRDDVRQPADAAPVVRVHGRRAAGAARLAAVEPHLWR